MDKRARIFCIFQLFFAFTLLAWSFGYPFMGELFTLKTKMSLYESILHPDNAVFFDELPDPLQQLLMETHDVLRERYSAPFGEKLARSFRIVFLELPPFALAWLVFSVVIAVLILMRVESALTAAWLLPVIVLAYGVDNYYTGKKAQVTAEERLFPSEDELVRGYMDGGLSKNIWEQQEQLQDAFNRFLVENYSEEGYLPEAYFNFTIARLERLSTEPSVDARSFFRKRESVIIVALYLIWNMLFAWMVRNRSSDMAVLQTAFQPPALPRALPWAVAMPALQAGPEHVDIGPEHFAHSSACEADISGQDR